MSDEGPDNKNEEAAPANRADYQTGQVERHNELTGKELVLRSVAKFADILTPEALRALSSNLKHITDTRTRRAIFALCFWLGFVVAAGVLTGAAAHGLMLGLPFSAAIALFFAFLSAVSLSNIGALQKRFTTPERQEIEDLDASMSSVYDAIDLYARRQRDSGASQSEIKAEVDKRNKQALNDHLKKLKAISRKKAIAARRALPPLKPDQAPPE